MTDILDNLQHEASIVEQQYKDGINYKKNMGFLDDWPEYERFKANQQWPKTTPKTKNWPRPVINVIKKIENHKVSSVLNENIKMVFSPEEVEDKPGLNSEAADIFTKLADATFERIKQHKLNEEALENASNRGTGLWHYYWNASVKGGSKLKYLGDMEGEILDPLSFCPGNPQCREIQPQPYIIISKRELLDTVREEARNNSISAELISLIQPDKNTKDEGYDSAQIELNGSQKVTVLTKYWKDKKTGTIWFVKVCSGIVIKEPTDTEMKLYPIAIMQWEKREKSIFGIGDTEGLIGNQKAINLLMAFELFSLQLTGWPKMRYKKGAINPTKITNTPGEMIEDSSPNNGWGVEYFTPPQINNQVQIIVDKLIDLTETMSGATETSMGETPSKQLPAAAIMMLQKASGISIDSIRRRFYQSQEDIGLIWQEFWKVKYNINRMITVKDNEENEYSTEFLGTKYADTNLKLKIDIGPASSYSEALAMASLDKFYDRKDITFEQYLKIAPQNVVPFKENLLKLIDQNKQQEMLMMQLVQQNKLLMEMVKKLPPEVQQTLLQQVEKQPPQMENQAMQQLNNLQQTQEG